MGTGLSLSLSLNALSGLVCPRRLVSRFLEDRNLEREPIVEFEFSPLGIVRVNVAQV